MSNNSSRPAIFLDRDGVINYNHKNYVRSWAQLRLIPGTLEALARLATSPYALVIVTNQSGVNRGMISLATANQINDRLVAVIRENGGRIDRVEMCPCRPEENCPCRKPEPGMLLSAARALSLDLKRSWMVGDALSDLQAGQAAGARPLFVLSGRHTLDNLATDKTLIDTPHFTDLAAATDYILQHSPNGIA